MSLRNPRLVLGLSLLSSVTVIAGCGGSGSSVSTPTAISVTASTNTTVAPGETVQFSESPITAVTWEVNGHAGGSSNTGTINSNGLYASPTNATSAQQITISAVPTATTYSTGTAVINTVGTGQVTTTNNGQVANYSIDLPSTVKSFKVEFGQDPSYGRSTWSVNAPSGGGTASVLVAGMIQNTNYHMRANITLSDGSTVLNDLDHSFTTTQSVPTNLQHTTMAGITPGMTPQPGVELMTNIVTGGVVYDLNGNMLWGYPGTDDAPTDQWQPMRQLPNGHMLYLRAQASPFPIEGPVPASNAHYEIKEVGLDNTVYNSVTMSQLNASLATWAQNHNYLDNQKNVPQLVDIHHEVVVNPTTGHWLIIGNYLQYRSDVTGYPANTPVLGDVVMDVDPNNSFAMTWFWNEFDHLDVNRHPFQFPDWTHTNAIVYSTDDGNILVSSRHQAWVMKVKYTDGTGDGTLMWRLGYQGDFKLVGGTEPQDWNNAQHLPAFTTSNTTGNFGLTMLDNGTFRLFDNGSQCLQQTITNLCYSRTPQFTIDETDMTATLVNANDGQLFAVWGGNAEVLANGDMEGDYAGVVPGTTAIETIPGATPQLVWYIYTPNTYEYRGERIQSLYPGVQWTGTEDAEAQARIKAKAAAAKK